MTSLPHTKVVPGMVFETIGVDSTGLIQLFGKGGRHKVVLQVYIAIFVGFSTKAIHLEPVSNLTTEAFIAALTRFVSGRGIPKKI